MDGSEIRPDNQWPMVPLIQQQMPADFETLQEARQRDEQRAKQLRLSRLPGAAELALRIAPTLKLSFRSRTLASACYLRFVRMHFHHTITGVFQPYPDDEICMVTMIPDWSAPVGKLSEFPLDQKLDSFAQQLRRGDVLKISGPLVAAVHGEYDATFNVYRLHLHLLTTVSKAAMIRSQLGEHRGYQSDEFRDDPIHIKRVDRRGRDGLITYLVKPYWTMRNSYQATDPDVDHAAASAPRWKRGLDQPLKRDQLAEVLLWLDGLRFGQMIYASGVTLPYGLRRL